jgi:enterochelin esterase-like enzyme
VRARFFSSLVAVAVALLAGAPDGGTASSAEPQIRDGSFYSKALRGTIHYSVALPDGYATSGLHYPVVYFLHGLPAGPTTYRGIKTLAQTLALNHLNAILVGAQGARKGDTDPEWHNWGPGRNWESATASELVRQVDAHYRTIASRSGRAIVGESAGGYGAVLIGIHNPATYHVIESWSGYFLATDPTGKPLKLANASIDANAHFAIPALKRTFARYPKTFFGFYIGNIDPYPGFVADNRRLDRELTAARVPHRFQIYKGAHTHAFWAEHDDKWLMQAVNRLAAAS